MSSYDENDEEIIDLFKNGDQEAFKELVERYSSPIFNFSARLAGRNEAPDIVQEIFIKVWKKISNFDASKASFKTWIFTVARNTITDFLRKKKDYLFSDLENFDKEEDSFAQNIPDESLLPGESMQKMEDKEFMEKTLTNLRSNYQEILTLRYQEDMTFAEIGEILGKPLNTVKSQHRRALMELEKMLEK